MAVLTDIGRFAIIPEWLLDSDISPTAIKLFAVMAAKYADRDTGSLFPSRKELAAKLGVHSRSTVDHALAQLESVGALSIENRKDAAGDPTSNLYMLHYAQKIGIPLPENQTGIPENRETPPPENRWRGYTRKLVTEPESIIEPKSIEPKSTGRLPVHRIRKQLPEPEITLEVRQKMLDRWGPVLGPDTIDDRIKLALSHKNAKNYSDMEQYVNNWLRNDADRTPKEFWRKEQNGTSEGHPDEYSQEAAELDERKRAVNARNIAAGKPPLYPLL